MNPYPQVRGGMVASLFGWGIALQAFGAVYQPEALGFLAASPGVPLLLLAALLALRGAKYDPIARKSWWLLGWGLLCSLISVAVFGLTPVYLTKIVPLLILSTVWIAPLLCLPYLSTSVVRTAVTAGLLITAVGYLSSDLLKILPSGLHALIFGGGYETYVDSRPRAFMTETSHFAALVGRYAMVLLLLREAGRAYDPTRLIIWVVGIALALLITESKGGAVSMCATLLALSAGRKSWRYIFILVPVAWWIADSQVEAISFDIENFTSTSTRVGLWLAGLCALVVNPAGWGYYGFYGTVETFGAWSMDYLSDLPFLFTELQVIVNELTSVSYKSTFLDFAVTFGLPFLLLLRDILKRLDLSDGRVRCALAYFFISSASTAGHESIAFFLGIAVLVKFYSRPLPVPLRAGKEAPSEQSRQPVSPV